MADISKINAVLLANIAEIDDVLAANIAKVNGLVFSTAPAFTGLLDTYTGAAVAYSVRRLYSGYTGAALRVRRDSDNTEQDIGFDSNGDLDTSALATFVGSGNNGYIKTVYDQAQSGGTGSGTDITNSTTTTQPKIYDATSGLLTEGINGRALLTFTRGSSILRGGPAITGPWTCIGTNKNTGYGCRYVANDSSNFMQSGRASYSFKVSNTSYLNASGPGPAVFCTGIWVENDTNSYVQWNSPTSTGNASGTVPALDIASNAYYGGNGNQTSWNEIVIWGSALSATNYNGINADMNAYYGIGNFGTPTSGLLATYTGAAAAYSVRQLANTAALAMRIREDGTDTETDIGFDSNGDLDTAAISSHCGANNGYVVTWYDQAGSQVDATQTTTANQPQIYNGTAVITENGKPAVDFRHPMNLTFTNTALITAFVACRSDTVNATSTNRVLGGTTSTRYPLGSNRTFGGNFSASIGTSPSLTFGSATDTTQKLIYANNQSGTQYLSVDGATPTSATITAGNVDMLGSDRVLSYFTHNGTVQEVLLWTTDESSNRTGIENNVNTYFSIY